MYAIVDIAGQQFKVEKDQKLFVHRLEGDDGKKVSFDRVLMIDTGNKVTIGDPLVKGASVEATILGHVKGDKVLVFKKKRRKGYQKLTGHRQFLTQIQIDEISEKGGARAEPAKEAKKAPEKPKAEEKPKAKAQEKPKAKAKAEEKPEAKKEEKPEEEAKPKEEPKKKEEPKTKTEKKPEGKEEAKAKEEPKKKKE